MGARRHSRSGSARARGRIRTTRRRSRGSSVEDIDGDGRILQMRIPDPNGLWKSASGRAAADDPPRSGRNGRHLLPRAARGPLRELRRLHAASEEAAAGARSQPQLSRRAGGRSSSSSAPGPYPTSEPEVRAVVDFIVRHPNITGGTTFHTWSGVLLRPFEHLPDEEMHAEDLWVYQAVGTQGHRAHRLPGISVYHEFRYHPKSVIGGTFDWIYEHLGLFSWVVEIWSPMREAGITDYKYIDWFRDHPPEDDLKLIRWSDDEARRRSRTSAGSRSTIRSSAASRSAAGTASTRSRNPPLAVARARARALSGVARVAGADLAEARAGRTPAPTRVGRRRMEGDARRRRTRAGCRRTCRKRALARKMVRGIDRRDRAAGGRDARRRQAARRARASSKAGRTSTPASRSGPITTSPTIA